MLLSELLIGLLPVVGLVALLLWLKAEKYVEPATRVGWTADRISVLLFVVFVCVIAVRSRHFGVDTEAYSEVFNNHCKEGMPHDSDPSFFLSALLIDFATFGACSVDLLPAAWILLVGLGTALAAGSALYKIRYLTLFLISLVGIELTTNALRQGISAGLCVAAISEWRRNRFLSVVYAAGAVGLHLSAALVFAAAAVATLSWGRFATLFIGSVVAVAISVQRGLSVVGLDRFLYEIKKYLAHDSDEYWIRLLSYTSLLCVLIAPLISASSREQARYVLSNRDFGTAMRLAATCLPFLTLPYFGYRYVYGVFPVVLWLVMSVTSTVPSHHARAFAVTLLLNWMILIVWTQGSSYMQSVPILEW